MKIIIAMYLLLAIVATLLGLMGFIKVAVILCAIVLVLSWYVTVSLWVDG